jgi:hypothetical protein
MTALSGLALLMEGSTADKGRHARSIRRAADWLMHECHNRSGLITKEHDPSETGRYTFGHGYAALFLACVYETAEDKALRHRLQGALNRAVQFTASAQSTRGGWFYTAAKDANDQDEGATTLVQIQGLRAAHSAGIPVDGMMWQKALQYLQNSTTVRGGVVYSLSSGGVAAGTERPALTAGAIAAAFSPDEYSSNLAKKWIAYCRTAIPLPRFGRFGHDEFTHFYFAQAVYGLGDNGYAKLFPKSAASDRLTWTSYRTGVFDHLLKTQDKDGSWRAGAMNIGPVYSTALNLVILQLDKNVLPVFEK